MSASREKKQRQGGTRSDKAMTAKQQEEQLRRKTIRYAVIGAVVAVLVIALLVWDSGFFQARTAAVSVGGTNYSAAEASYFYHNTGVYWNTIMYAQIGYSNYNVNVSPRDQVYGTAEDGAVMTYHDYFMDAMLRELNSITALYDAAMKDGMKAADVKAEVDAQVASAKQSATTNGYSSFKQFLAANYGKFVTPSVFRSCLTRVAIANSYLDAHEDSLSYTNEELRAYYGEHADELDTFQYSYLYFTPEALETEDADGNKIERTDEEKQAAEELKLAEAKTKADAAAAVLGEGRTVDEASAAAEPRTSAEGNQVEGSSLSGVYADWLKNSARKDGDVTVIENSTYGYYAVRFEGRSLDETPTADTRHILIRAEMDSGASEPTDEQMAAAKAKAEDLLSQWKSGAATEDSFAELANANSDDGGSNTNGGLYEKVYRGRFVTNYDEWLFDSARKSGDTAVVENRGDYYGYHVVYYVKQNPDDFKWMSDAKEAMVSDDTQEWLDGLKAGYAAAEAGGAKYLGT